MFYGAAVCGVYMGGAGLAVLAGCVDWADRPGADELDEVAGWLGWLGWLGRLLIVCLTLLSKLIMPFVICL